MFNGVRIEVSFQLKPQLMFRYMAINVKVGFMAVLSL